MAGKKQLTVEALEKAKEKAQGLRVKPKTIDGITYHVFDDSVHIFHGER